MKIIITGATGFLGNHLVKAFIQQGHEVISIGRNPSKGRKLQEIGSYFYQTSLENIENNKEVASIFKNTDVIVHSAAFSSPWGKKEEFAQSNIIGTQKILELAIKYKVKRFIHISTPSLYFKFKDEINISESTPLSPPFASLYTESKYEAEKLVDAAHQKNGLFTITLRPRGIFGPGDDALLPRLIKVAGSKGLPTIGNGQNIIDLTYVSNVVHAVEKSILAPELCNGQKYNITNDESIHLWTFLNELLHKLQIKPSKVKIPYFVAYYYAFILEFIHTYFINGEPKLTRYTVGLLSKNQTLNIEKAKIELGYTPKVSMKEATVQVLEWWKNAQS